MRISNTERTIVNGASVVPIAFVYDGYAFYFDMDAIDDSKTTIAVNRATGEPIYGLEANQKLVASIQRYGEERGEVWIARWFADSVAYELGEDE